MSRNVIRFMLLLAFLMILPSCGQGDIHYFGSPDAAAPAPAAADAWAVVEFEPQAAGAVGSFEAFFDFDEVREGAPHAPAERLIIQTANVHLETEQFDSAVSSLRDVPGAFGGYSQSERLFTVQGQQRFEIVIRVPAADFDNALLQIQEIASTRFLNVSAEDVTDRFYDTASRLETRLIEEERLLALIDQTSRLADLLELESRLAATRLQIERYRRSLADMASQITYSTIHAHIFDVEVTYEAIAAASFGERIGGAFGSSVDGTISVLQFIIVVLAGAIIPLAVISPLIILLVFRRRKKIALAESG